jgi:hypothetical protein
VSRAQVVARCVEEALAVAAALKVRAYVLDHG